MIGLVDQQRREEIETRLAGVQQRIDRACRAAGRSGTEITLIVVTKFFPASDVALLADLGVRHVGENRHQEAVEKAAQCADLDLQWHYIGALQSNKAAAVAGYSDVVQSVDRAKLLAPLARGAHERGRDLDCLVQVSLDPPEASGRSGVEPERAPDLAKQIIGTEGLRLLGVMGVAPLGGDPRAAFAGLRTVSSVLRRLDPSATWVSAGMSGDLEEAVHEGATHLRIGSAVLGPRPGVK